MEDELIGKIAFFGFNWAPRGYMVCWGQVLPVSTNQALFSLIGPYFGPYSQTQFYLPDLRGRVVVGQGDAPFGTFVQGQAGGLPTTTITTDNMPSHTHTSELTLQDATTTVKASGNAGANAVPGARGNSTLAASSDASVKIYNAETPAVELNVAGNTVSGSVTIGSTGGSVPVNNMQPYLTLNACIATVGIYPSRN